MSTLNRISINFNRLVRALQSGSGAARWSIFRMAIRPLTLGLDFVLAGILRLDRPQTSTQRFVLICSPPRSGSTVIYQVLTRVFRCGYVSNLHQLFPRRASILLRRFGFLFRAPRGLSSYYGHTREMLNVNEGNALVDYWFRSGEVNEIRERFLDTMTWISGGDAIPVLVKNVGAYNRLELLSTAVPELVFVRITRDRQQVVESELRAFRELGYFSPIPDELRNRNWDDPVEFAVRQINAIERAIESQLESVPEKNLANISYDQFCQRPAEIIDELSQNLGIEADISLLKDSLHASYSTKVSPAERDRITELLLNEKAEVGKASWG